METLHAKALRIASEAHAHQKDKFGHPYLLHVMRVSERGLTEREKICGLLHDLIEDTPWTIDQLRAEGFPEDILEVVHLLTKPEGANYMEYVKVIAKNPLARQVKLNDLQDNMDLRRVPELREKDLDRVNRYISAFRFLTEG
jgi:(p)ppGpp synthase/HD superfamily hydrolase